MFAEFGGNKTYAWELVVKKELSEVENHKIEVIYFTQNFCRKYK